MLAISDGSSIAIGQFSEDVYPLIESLILPILFNTGCNVKVTSSCYMYIVCRISAYLGNSGRDFGVRRNIDFKYELTFKIPFNLFV